MSEDDPYRRMADSHVPKSERLNTAGIERVNELEAELREVQDRAAKERLAFANQAAPLVQEKNKALARVEELEEQIRQGMPIGGFLGGFVAGDVRWSADCYPFFNGKILMGLHKKWGRWMCPGGKLRPGEQPQDAARRELCEETGLEHVVFPMLPGAAPDSPAGLLQFRDIQEGGKRFLTFGFVALVTTDEVVNNGEFEELRWVTLDEARKLNIHPGCLAIVEQVFTLFCLE